MITAILFADIVGYSKLSELQVLSFVRNFLGAVASLIDARDPAAQPVVKNTWGDGTRASTVVGLQLVSLMRGLFCAAFYFVFTRIEDAGDFALEFSKLVMTTDWRQHGLPDSLSIRISLHAAPVFVVTDPSKCCSAACQCRAVI